MAEEGGEAPPEAPPPAPGEGEAAEGGGEGDDAGKSNVRLDATSRMSRKQSMYRSYAALSTDRVDVDRTALEAILDVSSRIQSIQKKSKVSMSTLALHHDSYKDKQVNKVVD